MCLDISKNPKPFVAANDIHCYKVVSVDSDTQVWYAPFQRNFTYDKDTRITSEVIASHDSVEEGLHTLKSFGDAVIFKEALSSFRDGEFKVVRCIIPKGSTYYEGKYANMVSFASTTIIMSTKSLNLWQRLKQRVIESF